MSKERELLNEACDLLDDYWKGGKTSNRNRELFYEIKELLAQLEQEPVACWGSFDLGGKCVGTHETRRLAAQIQGGNDVYPLYTSPPTREPIDAFKAVQEFEGNYIYKDGFIDGIKYAEKAHGIGE